MKVYRYCAVVISDRGHLDDPELLKALNDMGSASGPTACPVCNSSLDEQFALAGRAHAFANGWKHKEEKDKGADKLVLLLEQEVEIEQNACRQRR